MSHNITKRGSVYYFRRRIPEDLLDHYHGKREIKLTLGVKDRSEAMALARKHAVALDDEWQCLRSAPKPAHVTASKAMTPAEFEAWDRARMEHEEEVHEIEMMEEYQQEEDEAEADRLERVIRLVEQRRAAAGSAPLDLAVRVALGAPVPSIVPPAPPAPSVPTVPAPAGRPLSAFIPIWEREQKPETKTVQTARLTIRELGDPDVTTIRRQTIIEYRDRLLDAKKARATINARLSYVRILLRIAKDRGDVEVNHADDTALAPDRRAVESRMPYEPDQIQAVMAETEGLRESNPALFWLPRLALWTGARLNELHQLRKRDVQIRDGVPGLLITDEGEYTPGVPMRLKNPASRRWVPLAPPLREFAAWAAARQDGPLFPATPDKHGTVSAAFSRHYGLLLRNNLKIENSKITFHSWRHTFADMCRDAAVPPEVRMALMGHAEGGTAGAYGAGGGLPPRRLIEAINRLSADVMGSV